MLVFVIPLKSQEVSKSWERVTQLFERCIKSVCNQTSTEFHVIVVCNQQPKIEFTHPNITYLTVNFDQAKDEKLIDRGCTDKGRKILKGLIYARRFSPTHTMAVDADDCVSQKLAIFVKQHPGANGWFVNKGYKYQENSEYVYVKRWNFYKMCGSCNILRYDLNFLPTNEEYNRGYGYYKHYIDHEKVRQTLIEKTQPLQPLPFAGAVYVVETGENIYYDSTRLGFSILNRKRLNQEIKNEFGLCKLPDRTTKILETQTI